MTSKALVLYSGELGVGGANVFLQDLLRYLSIHMKTRFYLVGLSVKSSFLHLDVRLMATNRDTCVLHVREPMHVSSFDRVLERISTSVKALVSDVKPGFVIVNSTNYAVLAIIDKLLDRLPDVFTVLHDGGFFCPLKHMWDPIKGRPCRMPCLSTGEIPRYCIDANILLKLGYVQPLFNPLKPGLLKLAKALDNVKLGDEQRLWSVSRRVLEGSTVIVPSMFMASLVKRFADIKPLVIRHGAQQELFSLALKPKNRLRVNVGFVGDVSLHKGVHVFLEAINDLVREAGTDVHQVLFYIIGSVHSFSSTSIGIIQKYRHLMNKHTKLLGVFKSRVKIYSMLDVLVLPSICHENAPLTVIEGIASGRYVVASNVGGIPEYLSGYPRGFLVEHGDVYRLAEVLKCTIVLASKSFSSISNSHRYVDSAENVFKVYKDFFMRVL